MDLSLLAISLTLILAAAIAHIFLLRHQIKNLREQLKNTQTSTQPGLELSEFLSDQARYGYSFLRVDPKSVMLRTPRDV